MNEIESVEDLEKLERNSSHLLDALLKMFERTLNALITNLEQQQYEIQINSKLFESHVSIMRDLAKDLDKIFDMQYRLGINKDGKETVVILSSNYTVLLATIKDIQLYTKFQTARIKGVA